MGSTLEKFLKDPESEQLMDAVFKKYDKNGDGVIDVREYQELTLDLVEIFKRYESHRPKQQEAYLKNQIMLDFIDVLKKRKNVDQNGDGAISKEQWKASIQQLLVEIKKKQLDENAVLVK
jgi:Ca2+-binding EF-hand superfamily protein